MNGLRRALYRWARILGDVNAVKRGPGAVARRQARKSGYKSTARILRKMKL